MNRRSLLKTAGFAIAGSALLPFSTSAQTTNLEPKPFGSDNALQLLSGNGGERPNWKLYQHWKNWELVLYLSVH